MGLTYFNKTTGEKSTSNRQEAWEKTQELDIECRNITQTKLGVFAYLTEITETTCTTGDEWYPLAGAFTNNPIENFVFDTDHIKYIGTQPKWFKISWAATLSGDSNGITSHVTLKINDTVREAPSMGIFLKTANEEFTLGGVDVVYLSTNDEIQIVLKADDDGDKVKFYHFTTSINRFF